jgi:phenylpyruvate tautomerase PptA (4-oxalocrotonate tautomerase family)
MEKVNWRLLSKNPAAIHILEKNLDKVDWAIGGKNSNIFKSNECVIKLELLHIL